MAQLHSRSVYWRYFQKLLGDQKAKCNLCSKVIKTTSGNSTGLKTHLIHQHPEVRSNLEKAKAEQGQERRAEKQPPKYRAPRDCPECGKRLGNQRNLNRHLLIIHQKHGASKAFTCHLCGRIYGTGFLLKRHIQNRRCLPKPPLIPLDQRFPQFACEQCDKKFHRRRERTIHVMRDHSEAANNRPTQEDCELSKSVAKKQKKGKFVCHDSGYGITCSKKSGLRQHNRRFRSAGVTQKPLGSTR